MKTIEFVLSGINVTVSHLYTDAYGIILSQKGKVLASYEMDMTHGVSYLLFEDFTKMKCFAVERAAEYILAYFRTVYNGGIKSAFEENEATKKSKHQIMRDQSRQNNNAGYANTMFFTAHFQKPFVFYEEIPSGRVEILQDTAIGKKVFTVFLNAYDNVMHITLVNIKTGKAAIYFEIDRNGGVCDYYARRGYKRIKPGDIVTLNRKDTSYTAYKNENNIALDINDCLCQFGYTFVDGKLTLLAQTTYIDITAGDFCEYAFWHKDNIDETPIDEIECAGIEADTAEYAMLSDLGA